MDTIRINETQQVLLLVGAIFITCVLVFWPLITVLIWSAAIATALMPFHKKLSRMVKPSVSVVFITVWVLLVILLVLSVSLSIVYGSIEYIGAMVASLVHGFQNTGISAFLPTFTEAQLSHMPDTLVRLLMESLLSLTSNVMQSLISIIIFFLSLSMLLFYGEQIWRTLTCTLSPKLYRAVERMSEISSNTIYALIIVQISAAIISFLLALPFFFILGVGDPLLFATLIGLAMLIPLIGAQVMILFFALYFMSLGDTWSAVVTLFVGYPLLSGWIDFYYRPVMIGNRVAIPPVMMIIGIFAGVPFMGIVGFIVGPVLIALAVTGYKILTEEVENSGKMPSQGGFSD
ncbi:MAG: AI-2E family transporter [Methanoregulaceae archaeon]|nr:AI-2E family transporter [Methanoregulaceae archaeon]